MSTGSAGPLELRGTVRGAARWIGFGYLAVIGLLIALQRLVAGSEIAAMRRLTSLRRSDGLTSWVVASLAVLVVLAVVLVLISALRAERGRPLGWTLVLAVAVAVAIDRGTRITALLAYVEHRSSGSLPDEAWLVPWTLAGLLTFLFLWRASPAGRRWWAIAAASLLAAGFCNGLLSASSAARSVAVVCTGAGLTASLIGLLAQLAAAGPIDLTLSPVARRRLLWGMAGLAVVTFSLLAELDRQLNTDTNSVNEVVQRYFNPANEASLASWVSTTQTLMFALTLWMVRWTTKIRGAVRASGWLVLAACFTYVSLDDGAMVHERVATLVNSLAASAGPDALIARFPSYTWQLVFLPLLSALAAFVVLFLWATLQRPGRRILMLAGLSCLALAVGMDYVEGLTGIELSEAFLHRSRVIEETIEMFGVHLLWLSVLAYATATTPSLRLHFLADN